MQINEIFQVTIEKMLYEGKSIARFNGVTVFIKGGCPEDVVRVKCNKINKNFVEAEIVEIIQESKHRIKPFCAMHNVCGSCDWQHIDYDEQLKQKRNIVYEIIKNIAGIEIDVQDVIPSPKLMEYRCKVQYPVTQTKVSKRLLSGYYKKNSHELINIKYCPIHPNIINEINENIKELAQKYLITGYDEQKHIGLLKHIVYRISADCSNILIIFVINSEKIDKNICKLAQEISQKYKNIVGISANLNPKRTNVILSNNTKTVLGNGFYIDKLDNISYKISANSFFQVNPHSAINIFNKVKEIISLNIKTPTILDAYSGVSSIGIWLSSIASKVVCVEEVLSASDDARENIKLNNINNIEIINGDATKTFAQFIKDGIKFDVSVIDPPRKGSTVDGLYDLARMTSKYIVYVSCNPTTLARDIKELMKHKFKPILVQPVDMFPHTYHIETVVLFEKYKKEV